MNSSFRIVEGLLAFRPARMYLIVAARTDVRALFPFPAAVNVRTTNPFLLARSTPPKRLRGRGW